MPSDSEAVTRIRTEILEQLHKSKDKRLNAIIKRQVILKQCEKVCVKNLKMREYYFAFNIISLFLRHFFSYV